MLCLDGGFLYRAKWIFTNDFRPMFLFCFDLLNNFDISSVRFCCFVSSKLIVRLLAQADKLNSNKWNAHINNILYCAKWKSLDIIFSSLFFKKKKSEEENEKKTELICRIYAQRLLFVVAVVGVFITSIMRIQFEAKHLYVVCIYRWSTMNSGGRND